MTPTNRRNLHFTFEQSEVFSSVRVRNKFDKIESQLWLAISDRDRTACVTASASNRSSPARYAAFWFTPWSSSKPERRCPLAHTVISKLGEQNKSHEIGISFNLAKSKHVGKPENRSLGFGAEMRQHGGRSSVSSITAYPSTMASSSPPSARPTSSSSPPTSSEWRP